ncbi:hypothetical protein EJB05_15617, partial [Eragrostis curvula]
MRPARRGGGAAARALLALLFLVLLVGSRCAVAIRVEARSRSQAQVALLPRKAMPTVGTRPVPSVRLPPAEEESKRRIPSCPDPLHNR